MQIVKKFDDTLRLKVRSQRMRIPIFASFPIALAMFFHGSSQEFEYI